MLYTAHTCVSIIVYKDIIIRYSLKGCMTVGSYIRTGLKDSQEELPTRPTQLGHFNGIAANFAS